MQIRTQYAADFRRRDRPSVAGSAIRVRGGRSDRIGSDRCEALFFSAAYPRFESFLRRPAREGWIPRALRWNFSNFRGCATILRADAGLFAARCQRDAEDFCSARNSDFCPEQVTRPQATTRLGPRQHVAPSSISGAASSNAPTPAVTAQPVVGLHPRLYEPFASYSMRLETWVAEAAFSPK